MKAKVQYNDLVGTAAADVSDNYRNSIQVYLKDTFPRFDDDRYRCDGCYIFTSEGSKKATIRFICYDNKEDKFVYFIPMKEYSLHDIVAIFKRFSIVVGNGIENVVINDDDWFDLE